MSEQVVVERAVTHAEFMQLYELLRPVAAYTIKSEVDAVKAVISDLEKILKIRIVKS